MLEFVQKVVNKVIAVKIPHGEDDHIDVVNPTSLTVVLMIMIALTLWAFNVYGEDLRQIANQQDQRATYDDIREMLGQQKQISEMQQQQQQLQFNQIKAQVNNQQQIQQQIQTNQGEAIQAIAALQAALNVLLRERHPDAFDGVDARINEQAQEESLSEQRLLAGMVSTFIVQLKSQLNTVEEFDGTYLLRDPGGDVLHKFGENQEGNLALIVDLQPYATSLAWADIDADLQAKLAPLPSLPVVADNNADTSGTDDGTDDGTDGNDGGTN